MGLAVVALLALATVGFMFWAGMRGPTLTLAAAALAFGCAGYALQGQPGLAGSPRGAADRPPPLDLAEARAAMMGRFTPEERWLTMADSLARRGKTEDAARLLAAQVKRFPGDYVLWVGLGNALAEHARSLTPAARFAFERAQQLAPKHPAPRFFLGLAEARSGNREEAARLWWEVLADAPADASWRPIIEQGLKAIGASPQGPAPTRSTN
jgi:cytochrome c-type biogenesis protein CcmH